MNLISEHRSVTRSSLVCKATCCGSQSRAPFRRPGSWSQCMRKMLFDMGTHSLKLLSLSWRQPFANSGRFLHRHILTELSRLRLHGVSNTDA